MGPTFDDYVAAPPLDELETQGLSFGSLAMTDAEMNRLQAAGARGSLKKQSQRRSSSQQQPHQLNSNNNIPAAPSGGLLEPTGISIGDVSMMSAGTNFQMKLDDVGTSFGTAMSFGTFNPDMVDGGLMEAVGTSFGSLSLDVNNRDALYKTLEIAAGGPEVPPMFRSEEKASGNLLDCSDTESENSADKEKLTKQKSQAWEMMKTTLEKQTSKGASAGSQELMPPPVGKPQHSDQEQQNTSNAPPTFENIEVALPATTMESNFSTLSAWSAADDDFDNPPDTGAAKVDQGKGDDAADETAAPPPPPQLVKTDSL